uniref:uncharacterized protein LOC105352667 n=1 Tax=Fragaria vesca subsp. vesca TaxID=101020 RepID=UPI0005CB5613|nr:PREDICTED: uncharacterized protein LOC105352667 [Fragaria vesca subsp. vesca]
MFKKPNLGSAESSKKSPNEQRSYVCSFCSMSFPSSQSFAGHHNCHRLRHIDRWDFAQEDLNNAGVPALPELNDSKIRPLSPAGSITPGSRHDDEHNSRAFHTFMPTEPSPAPTSRFGAGFGVELEEDLASGSSTGSTSSYGENPKKRKLSGLARLKTGSADDESWLKL